MRFGIGLGHFLEVLKLANAVRQKWVDAPAEYASIREQYVVVSLLKSLELGKLDTYDVQDQDCQ